MTGSPSAREVGNVLAAMGEAVLVFDATGCCTFASVPVEDLLGTAVGDLVGRTPGDSLPELAAAGLSEAMLQVADEGGVRIELRHEPTDRWLECHLHPTCDGVVAHLHDTTERRRAELAHQASEARLLRAQAAGRIGSWELDLATRTMWASDQAFRLYGLDRTDNATAPLAEVQQIPLPEDRPRLDAALDALLAGTAPYDVVFRIRNAADDGVLVVHSLAEVVRDDTGQPVRVVGTVQDVTASALAEEERASLISAIEQTSDVVVLQDNDELLTYVNPAFTRVYGYPASEVIGRRLDVLASGRHDEAFWRRRTATARDGRTWTGTITNRRRDGGLVDVDASLSPVRGPGGELRGFVQVARDVTEQRALEARLTAAQRLAAVGQLAGGIAHDFNNLLTAIRGYASLLAETTLDDPVRAREDLGEIIRGADRAAALTRQLLAFSGRQVLEPVVVDPADEVQELYPMLRRLIGEHIEIEIRSTGAPARVLVDPGQLEQVIVNLVLNARDAMPLGGRLRIEVTAEDVPVTSEDSAGPATAPAAPAKAQAGPATAPAAPRARPGPRTASTDAAIAPHGLVRLSVTDTGVGMDDVTKARIFEPFFTTKGPGRGTGMGLASVHGIVTQSGGTVEVTSERGRGTTVHVILPRVLTAPAPAISRRPAEVLQSSGHTVLVVEDGDAVRRFAGRVLEMGGYRVLLAADAVEARALADDPARTIDLLVTDVVMPGLSGPDLAAQLERERPTLRTLFVSGYAEDVLADHSLAASGRAFLAKPYTVESLLAAARAALAVK